MRVAKNSPALAAEAVDFCRRRYFFGRFWRARTPPSSPLFAHADGSEIGSPIRLEARSSVSENRIPRPSPAQCERIKRRFGARRRTTAAANCAAALTAPAVQCRAIEARFVRACTAKNSVNKKVVRENFRAESMHCKWKAVLIKRGAASKLRARRVAGGVAVRRFARSQRRPFAHPDVRAAVRAAAVRRAAWIRAAADFFGVRAAPFLVRERASRHAKNRRAATRCALQKNRRAAFA